MHLNSIRICHQLHHLVLLALLCLVESQFSQSGTRWNSRGQRETNAETCRNARNEAGTCINIRQCASMLDILKTAKGDPQKVEFLRKSVCTYEGRDPVVCCSDTVRPSTNSWRPTTPNPRITTPSSGSFSQSTLNKLSSLPGQDRCGVSKAVQTNRIVGGQPAELGAWPWMTALGYRKLTSSSKKPNWLCGGALVSTRHVITAAHCISARSDLQLYVVRLGELNLDSNVKDGASPVDILIEEKIAHPGFNTSTFVNDIGILRLQKEVTFTDLIQPICLPYTSEVRDKTFVDYEPFVAGWGTIASNGPPSTALLQVQLPVVDNADCKDNYKNIRSAVIDNRVLCAGYAEGGKDSCQGDSGGPLMLPRGLTYYLIGVVSYGKKCAEPGYPGVYTRVTNFLDWIAQNTK